MAPYRKFLRASTVCFVITAISIATVLIASFLTSNQAGTSFDDWRISFTVFLTIYVAFPAVLIGAILAAIGGILYTHTRLDDAGVYKQVQKTAKKKKKAIKRRAAKKRKK